MSFTPSNLRVGVRASGWPAYSDPSTAHDNDPAYLTANGPGGYNTLLAELAKTQDFLIDWGSKVVNLADIARKNGHTLGVDDSTADFREACSDSTKQIVYVPPNARAKITDTAYVGARKMIVSNAGARHFEPGLLALTPNKATLQMGNVSGLFGLHIWNPVAGHSEGSATGVRMVEFNLNPGTPNFDSFDDAPNGTSDGFIANCWLGNYGGGGTTIKIATPIQGYWFSNNVCDGLPDTTFEATAQMCGVRFFGNRFFGAVGQAFKATNAAGCIFVGNGYDTNTQYGNSYGVELANCADCSFTGEVIDGYANGLKISNSGATPFPLWFEEGGGVYDNANFFTNVRICPATDGIGILLYQAKTAIFDNIGLGMSVERADSGDSGAFNNTVPFASGVGASKCVFGKVVAKSPSRTKSFKWDSATSNCGVETLIRLRGSDSSRLLIDDAGTNNFIGRTVG